MIARTADRTLLIFELFADRLGPLTLSEIARALEMPVSSCASLMQTLQARGYLYEVGGRKAFYPTARWLLKAKAIAAADPVVERIQPHLERLRNEVDETALLGKRMGEQAIHLCIVESSQSIRYHGQVGNLKALHSTASGKAILASLGADERHELVARMKLTRGTQDTITQRKQLLQDVELGRQRGWWTSRGENVSDVMAMAAPVQLASETFTVIVAGPIARIEARQEKIAKALLAACRRVAQAAE